jgi:3-oxoacyl-[acyl-carrier protein] reductase
MEQCYRCLSQRLLRVTQPLLLSMIRQRWGRIINITSVAALLHGTVARWLRGGQAGPHGATRAGT